MRRPYRVMFASLLTVITALHVSMARPAQSPSENTDGTRAVVSPAVATLLRAATDAYQKMQTYQHTAEYVERGGQGGDHIIAFTLALERPNKFSYRSDDPEIGAAVSNGKIFTNLKNENGTLAFTRIASPASYKQINIVDDVTFEPIGTYLIALMLQGDALADKDIRATMEQATLKSVTEDNTRFDVLTSRFGTSQTPISFYFNGQTHLLHKLIIESGGLHITEIIENVKIDKPILPSMFDYTPPKNAMWIVRSGEPSKTERA